MPNDMYTINALANELKDRLVGGRIEKINQPEKDEVTFYVHNNRINYILVVSVNSNSPRIHLTTEKKDNPYVAPPFLMHLRKRLIGAKIEELSTVGFDRIICIKLKGKNEMSDEITNTLYIELMGRYSNIILCEENGIISEALRHISPENSFRCILPKVKYALPDNERIKPTEKEALIDLFNSFNGGNLANYITSNVVGFSSQTVAELLFRLNLTTACELNDKQARTLADEIDKLYNINKYNEYNPCVSIVAGNPSDFFIFPYHSLPHSFVEKDSLNQAVKECCLEKDRITRLNMESKELYHALRTAIKKTEKALSSARERIIACKDYETLRYRGEMITNYIYMLSRGMKYFDAIDYNTGETVRIPLDPILTPQENAQALFKKYSKQKRTIEFSKQQAIELERKLDYLNSIKTSLDLCITVKDLEGIKEELINIGVLTEKKNKKNTKKVSKPLPSLRTFSYMGYTIICGKNNIENDRLTFSAKPKDIWLHAKDAHGSHVIIKREDKTVTDKVIEFAAEVAAYYSERQSSGKAIVDYCEARFVKHLPGGGKGQVIYTDYNGINVSPNPHTEQENK